MQHVDQHAVVVLGVPDAQQAEYFQRPLARREARDQVAAGPAHARRRNALRRDGAARSRRCAPRCAPAAPADSAAAPPRTASAGGAGCAAFTSVPRRRRLRSCHRRRRTRRLRNRRRRSRHARSHRRGRHRPSHRIRRSRHRRRAGRCRTIRRDASEQREQPGQHATDDGEPQHLRQQPDGAARQPAGGAATPACGPAARAARHRPPARR